MRGSSTTHRHIYTHNNTTTHTHTQQHTDTYTHTYNKHTHTTHTHTTNTHTHTTHTHTHTRDAAPLLRGRRGTWWHPPWFHVAGVAQPHIYRRFAWQAWDRWHWVARLDWFRRRRDARDAAPLLRGRRGTWWHPPWFHVAGVAQPHIYHRFAWPAWDRWHWVARLDWFRRRRDAAPLLRGSRGTWWHPPWFHVAGVAQPHIYRRFARPAWDRWHWVARLDWFRRRRDARDAAPLLRGRRGTWWHPPWFHVAGVAQPHIYRRFAWQAWDRWHSQPHIYRRFAWQAWDRWHWVACLDWFRRRRDACDAASLLRGRRGTWWHPPWFHAWQAWHKLTSTVVLRGRRGTDGTGWRAWTGLGAAVTPVTPRHFCVAGVALGDIHLDFTWQAWHNLTSTVVLRGRRGTDGAGWRAWTGLGAAVTPVTPRHFCVAGVALGDIHLDFTWQAWHNLTSTVVLRGRRGTDGIGWRAWTGLGAAVTPRHFCVAAVALGDIHLDFMWQAWHNLTSTVVLRGRRGTDGTGWRAWTGLGAAVTPRHFCVAAVALGDIHLDFTWQACHNLTSTVVLRGRRGTDGTGWRAWTGLGAAVTPVTPRHFCVAGVALGDIHFRSAWQAWHKVTCVARRGTWWHTPGLTWQVWHNCTSTVVLRGRRGTDGTGWRAWTGLGARDARDAAPLLRGFKFGHLHAKLRSFRHVSSFRVRRHVWFWHV